MWFILPMISPPRVPLYACAFFPHQSLTNWRKHALSPPTQQTIVWKSVVFVLPVPPPRLPWRFFFIQREWESTSEKSVGRLCQQFLRQLPAVSCFFPFLSVGDNKSSLAGFPVHPMLQKRLAHYVDVYLDQVLAHHWPPGHCRNLV